MKMLQTCHKAHPVHVYTYVGAVFSQRHTPNVSGQPALQQGWLPVHSFGVGEGEDASERVAPSQADGLSPGDGDEQPLLLGRS